jgi:NAD(P)-dependent dehydrogenase (short-subunit alcohol dehydrogenase family)
MALGQIQSGTVMDKNITLVTGASRGLGYATALELGGPDRHIVALARTIGGLEELDDAIGEKGGSATLVPIDITDEKALQNIGLSIHERWGRLDTFVHCAAHAVPLSPVTHLAEKDMDRAWAVNARGTQRLITMFDPLLRSSDNGRAIYTNDTVRGRPFYGSYAASKAAAEVFWDAWALEISALGLIVRSFSPEPMPTALRARFYPGEDASQLATVKSQAQALIETLIS